MRGERGGRIRRVKRGRKRRTFPEVEDDSCTAETRSGSAQQDCIKKRVKEKLTFLTRCLYFSLFAT